MPPQVVTVQNAGKVASALSSEKCKRILAHLQKHADATETELAKDLTIPLSTVHYNMKVLVEAKLVLADTYSYSSRGKEVTHYRINKNPIVIVQEEAQLSLLRAIVPAAVIAAGVAIVYQLSAENSLLTPDQTVTALKASPMAAQEGARAMMAAAPTTNAPLSDAAATAVQATPNVVPFFLAGVISVLVLSFVILAVTRWWHSREK